MGISINLKLSRLACCVNACATVRINCAYFFMSQKRKNMYTYVPKLRLIVRDSGHLILEFEALPRIFERDIDSDLYVIYIMFIQC